MADLPIDRIKEAPPFTYSGVNLFRPFLIKEGRSEKKRWGVIFTCMASRAIHLEVASSLSTDSFLNAYRRFIGRRGSVRMLRCDRGTNFVGAKSELEGALQELDITKISRKLAEDSCDMINFNFNVPQASHMGGSWERLIRSVRDVLAGILTQHGTILDDESLRTFMVEAECVVNSRPLAHIEDDQLLTPQHLLTLKSKIVMPLPGNFVKEDVYSRKRWRRVQFLANQFWHKWRSAFLPTLQTRTKWTKQDSDLKVEDVVLLKDDQQPRCSWSYGRIELTYPSEDGCVRKVKVRTPTSQYDRPISKIVFLLRPGHPDEEP